MAKKYPDRPGYTDLACSLDAATNIKMSVATIREIVMAALRVRNMTPEEISDHTGIHFLNVRPRCTELKRLGVVRHTGARRPNRTGGSSSELELHPRYQPKKRRKR